MGLLPLLSEPAAANGDRTAILEEKLRALDTLALPAGTSLAELDLSLRRGDPPLARRNLPAAVEWLELVLGISVPTTPPVATPALTDEDLVARMPDDPDAVLAWLEQMAEEDTVDSSPRLDPSAEAFAAPLSASARTPELPHPTIEPQIDELSEDDLLSMPEDPDAVMAWLEGLAGGGRPDQREVASMPEAIALPVAPDVIEPPAELPAPAPRSRRRRGRKAQQKAQPVEEVVTEPQGMADVTIASPEAVSAEADVTFEEVNVRVEESGGELPEATVGAAVEADGLLVWPAADDLPDVLPLPTAPLEGDMAEADAYPAAPPVAARPRRRGRKPKDEGATTTESAILIIDTVEAADPNAGELPVESETSGEADTPPPPPETTPPTKPASWVDLLKPLR